MRKILLVSWYHPEVIFGGVETIFRYLEKELNAEWVNLDDVIKSLAIIPISRDYYRFAVVDRSYYVCKYLKQYEELFDLDLIIADDCTVPWYIPKAKLITIAQNPYEFIADKLYPEFYTIHNYIEFGKLYVELQKLQYDFSDVIVCPSEYMRKYAQKLTGYQHPEIRLIPHGIDTDLFKPIDLAREEFDVPADRPIGLWVGGFHPVKGWHVMQRIIKKFKDVYWICVFKHVISGKPILKNVRVLSKVQYDKMPELYNLADFYISTSLVESFGLCPFEAMACNTPIITPQVGYFDGVKEGVYDYGIVRNDLESAVADMLKLLKTSYEFNPRKFVWENLRKELWIKEWKHLIDEILS